MDDQLNVPLEDAELLAEVELTTNLIIAASEAQAPLTQEQVDALLGLREAQDSAAAAQDGAEASQFPAQQRRPE